MSDTRKQTEQTTRKDQQDRPAEPVSEDTLKKVAGGGWGSFKDVAPTE